MREVGELLKKERLEKGISLEEVSDMTKIQVKFLQSLENGDFSCFAGRVYLLGALRSYAENIGLNAEELLSYYEGLSGDSFNVQKSEYKSDYKSEYLAEFRSEYKKAEHHGGLIRSKERKPIPVVALIWVILLIVVLGGSLWYRSQPGRDSNQGNLFQNGQSQDNTEGGPDGNNLTDPLSVANERTTTPQEAPRLTQQSSGSREAVYLLNGVERMELAVHFTAKCWVEITRDGVLLEEKIYQQGEKTETFSGGDETKIRLGAPRGAWLEVNGLELNDWKDATNPLNVIIKKQGLGIRE